MEELWQYPELEPEAAIRPACPKCFHKVPDPEDKQSPSQAPHLRDTGIFGDRLIILKKIILMHMLVLACTYVCAPHICSTRGGQKMVPDLLETGVSCQPVARN